VQPAPVSAFPTQGNPYTQPYAPPVAPIWTPEPAVPLASYETLPSKPGPGAHTHDGFFIRPQLGVSETFLSPGPGINLKGAGSAIDGSIGFALTPTLVLAMAFSHSAGKLTASEGSNPPGLRAILFGFGPAVIYFLPLNFSLGAAVGTSRMQFTDDTAKITWTTGFGFLAKAEVGKEWWVSDNWSLGASLRYYYMRAKEASVGPHAPVWNANSICLLGSATFN
jgi:hypothetical protein